MTDVHTPEQRSFNMSRIRGKDTKPELVVRRSLHRLGFRFRLHVKNLPGKPDLVLPKYHAVIFIHGCFWHGHDCKLFKWPRTRKKFWREKISDNRARDEKNRRLLEGEGWRILEIWECAFRGTGRFDSAEVMAQAKRWILSAEAYSEIRSAMPGSPISARK